MPAVAANDRLEAGSATFRDFALASTANSLVDDSNPINREWTSNTAETLAGHGIELNDAMPAPDVQRTPAAFVQPVPC